MICTQSDLSDFIAKLPDLKPENVMLRKTRGDAVIKLIDFGCSEVLSHPEVEESGFRLPSRTLIHEEGATTEVKNMVSTLQHFLNLLTFNFLEGESVRKSEGHEGVVLHLISIDERHRSQPLDRRRPFEVGALCRLQIGVFNVRNVVTKDGK